MHFPRFAGLDHQADPGAARRAHEVMMHGAGGGQGADRHALGADVAVREHQQRDALGNRRARLGADAVEGGEQPGASRAALEGDVEGARLPAAVVHRLDRGELVVREDGMRCAQAVGVFFRDLQQVALRADVALQRHHHFLADGIDGRVGDLREQLLEVVVQHARLVGHHRQGAVVAHRAERVAQFRHQRQQHELHRLRGVAERLHPWQQGLLRPSRTPRPRAARTDPAAGVPAIRRRGGASPTRP